jgi:hypothetical protein
MKKTRDAMLLEMAERVTRVMLDEDIINEGTLAELEKVMSLIWKLRKLENGK